jgi:hypothetical protein
MEMEVTTRDDVQVNKDGLNVHFLVYTKAIQVQEDRDTYVFVNESCMFLLCL